MQFFDAFGVDLPKLLFQIANFLLLLWLLNALVRSRFRNCHALLSPLIVEAQLTARSIPA